MMKLILFFLFFSLTSFAQDEAVISLDPSPEENAAHETSEQRAVSESLESVRSDIPLKPEKPEVTYDPVDPTTSTPALMSEKPIVKRDFDPKANNWISIFTLENMGYELPYDFREGEKKQFKDYTEQLYGFRAGLGREFHLGRRFLATTRIEGYFLGTTDAQTKVVGDLDDLEYQRTTVRGQILGGEIVQALSFQFEFMTKNPFMGTSHRLILEPFLEGGIGMANALNQVDHTYDTTSQEFYRHRVEDQLSTLRFGAGFNILSYQGYFFYAKVSQFNLNLTKREETGYRQPFSGSGNAFKSSDTPDLDPVFLYSLGGGIKF